MPRSRTYRTTDVARAGDIHPNTVRLYEAWGYIPPAPRAANGYRQFSAYHLDQVQLVRLALKLSWISGPMRESAMGVIFRSAAHDLDAAHDHAEQLDTLLRAEQHQADAALRTVAAWLAGHIPATMPPDAPPVPLHTTQTARLLDVSTDVLRNWERDGLIDVPRDPANGYRQYGPGEIARLRVIRTLRRARYSTLAILRMLHRLDAGEPVDLRAAINTPDPDDDIQHATDRWLSTLAEMRAALDELRAHLRTMRARHS